MNIGEALEAGWQPVVVWGDEEEWRPVPGWETRYLVSDHTGGRTCRACRKARGC